MVDFTDLIDILNDSQFEETPVDFDTFLHSPAYLNHPNMILSDHQRTMVEAITQVLKPETLIELYGEVEGRRLATKNFFESIFMLGKGSGKDAMTQLGVAYVVYLLMCMKDPAAYYGRTAGDSIDIINIAINAKQANQVFFRGFMRLIDRSPWFVGKFRATADTVRFDKEVTVYSGHSERESWEGYNTLIVILDEIAGFAIENTTGNAQAKTANDIYMMYKGSVTSRFPDYGKLILLSWPRFKDDFIMTRYAEVVGEKTVIQKEVEVLVNPDLGDIEGNRMTIVWDEDHINYYTEPRVFALRRPSWEVNPIRYIQEYVTSFFSDYPDSAGRYACMPPDAVDAFFKSREKIEKAFNQRELDPVDDSLKPKPDTKYYIHVDLAQKIDRCALALSHVSEFKDVGTGLFGQSNIQPMVVVDLLKYWTPSAQHNVDFAEVRDYILMLHRKGFNIELVTFDRWNSTGIMDELNAYSVNTELLSVAKAHYTDMAFAVMEERVLGPDSELLREELLRLRVIRDKVDHPRTGGKDTADAVCGAIFNAIKWTPHDIPMEVEVHTYEQFKRDVPVPEVKQAKPKATQPMPAELAAMLDSLTVI